MFKHNKQTKPSLVWWPVITPAGRAVPSAGGKPLTGEKVAVVI